ncbi:hypothetical protein Q9Q95_13250 [Sphingomonas sp. DG1-23]|nr:hypothetical protein [Sphingomonas sp. DG1-23]MDP5279895.1 hypothetical protein [Sphingomonas sp. DG1-23]
MIYETDSNIATCPRDLSRHHLVRLARTVIFRGMVVGEQQRRGTDLHRPIENAPDRRGARDFVAGHANAAPDPQIATEAQGYEKLAVFTGEQWPQILQRLFSIPDHWGQSVERPP